VLVVVATALQGARAEDTAFFPSVELRCRPVTNGNCSQNTEPDVKVAPDGSAYVSAIIGVPGGTNFWRRAAGDTIFRYVGMPEYVERLSNRGVTPGGGDTAVAIAPVANQNGFHNIYVASLYAAGVTVATSRDGGSTWTTNLLGAPITADRQWIVADGANTVWVAYRDFPRGAVAVVARSDDGGTTFGAPVPVYEQDDQSRAAFFSSRWGSLFMDPSSNALYWPYTTVGEMNEAITGAIPQNPTGVRRHVVRMAVSLDGGRTWTNHTVHNADPSTRVDAVFPWAAVDAGGNLYAVWSTTTAVYLSRSTDQGSTWTTPVRVSDPSVYATVLPAVIGGRDGTVDVAYIGTTSSSVDDESGEWHVWFAQSLDGGATFSHARASDQPVHVGSVCLRGLGCDLPAPAGQPGDRALAEILTITIDADGMVLLASPYDFRNGIKRGSTQSLLIKQRAGTRSVDSIAPIIGIAPEPR
jgi:hypothetical protein